MGSPAAITMGSEADERGSAFRPGTAALVLPPQPASNRTARRETIHGDRIAKLGDFSHMSCTAY
jgi:hypothetical protein